VRGVTTSVVSGERGRRADYMVVLVALATPPSDVVSIRRRSLRVSVETGWRTYGFSLPLLKGVFGCGALGLWAVPDCTWGGDVSGCCIPTCPPLLLQVRILLCPVDA